MKFLYKYLETCHEATGVVVVIGVLRVSDLDLCMSIDAFDFAMHVTVENGRHVMRAVKSP